MKKLLTLIGAITLTTTTAAMIVSCGGEPSDNKFDNENETLSADKLFEKYLKTTKSANEFNQEMEEKIKDGYIATDEDFSYSMGLSINNFDIEYELIKFDKVITTNEENDEFKLDSLEDIGGLEEWVKIKKNDHYLGFVSQYLVWAENDPEFIKPNDEFNLSIRQLNNLKKLKDKYSEYNIDLMEMGKKSIMDSRPNE